MAKTGQITVNAVGLTPVAIIGDQCRSVRVMENPGVPSWPTTDFLVAKPTANDTPVRIPTGQAYTFQNRQSPGTRPFTQGQIIGYLQTVQGSTTFDQDEDY